MRLWIGCFLAFPWLTSCLSAPTSRSVSKTASEPAAAACAPKADDLPELVALSSAVLGGQGGGPLRSMFGGSIPPQFILYRSGTVLYAVNSAKGNDPFYLYRCAKLSSREKAKILSDYELASAMPDLYEYYDGRDPKGNAGYHEVFLYDADGSCRHAEIKGSLMAARQSIERIRSSVVAKLPLSIIDFLESLNSFNPASGKPWQPDRMLVALKPLERQPSYGTSPRPWPTTIPLTPPKIKEHRTFRNSVYFEARVPAGQQREFFKAVAEPVVYQGRNWTVGYRTLFPGDHYWASPFPTLKEAYSKCNRYQSHRNYWLLYGVSQ